MTTAYWWWSKSGEVEAPVLAPVLEPPELANPGNLTYYPGESINLRIDNNGGAATTWDANALPIGLSITQEFADHCIISGVAQALVAPNVVDPGDQTWYAGDPINLPLSNIGGPASLWETTDFPANIRITEQRDYSALIQNVDALPLAPLNTDFFVEYLLGQQEEQDAGYPGHGQHCIDNWNCYETGTFESCGIDPDQSVHFYDYARSALNAYSFLQSVGLPADNRWIDYADADTKLWNRWLSLNNYNLFGWFYFPAGQWAMYEHDPITYAARAETLRQIVINYIRCDGRAAPDSARETVTREYSYAILCYLDYLTLSSTAPDDPHWSDQYPKRRDLTINFAYQWMDECKEYGFLDPLDYMAIPGIREPNTVNIQDLSPWGSGILLETLYRIYLNDTTGDVDKPLLLNYCERIVNYITANGWSPQAGTGIFYRFFDYCDDDSQPFIGHNLGPNFGQYWCDRREGPGNGLWVGWRLQQCGIAYAITGNRRYIDEGDKLWDFLWTSRRSFQRLNGENYNQKENSEQLRYSFDYLNYRGDLDYNTQFRDASGLAPPIAIPTANVYPTIAPVVPQSVTVDELLDPPIQLSATNSPTQWNQYLLPAGLTLDDTGLIFGTPTGPPAESTLVTIFARNDEGTGGGVGEPIVIDFAVVGVGAPSITNPGPQTYDIGVPLTLTIHNIGGPIDQPDGWEIRVGWLPTGLSATDEGPYHLTISGTPSA